MSPWFLGQGDGRPSGTFNRLRTKPAVENAGYFRAPLCGCQVQYPDAVWNGPGGGLRTMGPNKAETGNLGPQDRCFGEPVERWTELSGDLRSRKEAKALYRPYRPGRIRWVTFSWGFTPGCHIWRAFSPSGNPLDLGRRAKRAEGRGRGAHLERATGLVTRRGYTDQSGGEHARAPNAGASARVRLVFVCVPQCK